MALIAKFPKRSPATPKDRAAYGYEATAQPFLTRTGSGRPAPNHVSIVKVGCEVGAGETWMRLGGCPLTKLVLTVEERGQLISWSHDGSTPSRAIRAEIILRCAAPGTTDRHVAAELGITSVTVAKWRKRFIKARLDGLISDHSGAGRPKTAIELTDGERAQLIEWSQTTSDLKLRCKIILACAEGKTNEEIAAELRIHPDTVSKWRNRFVHSRMDALAGLKPRGRPVTVTPEQIELVVTATTRESPKDGTRWSRASMARYSGLSTSTVGRIWRAFELRPHLSPPTDVQQPETRRI